MGEKRLTARAFHEADGVEDWRVLYTGANAYYRVASFAEGARFVAAIAEAADALGHFPDVDLRPEGVTVRTCSGAYGALSERDVELARRVSAAARTLQLEPDPAEVQALGIAVAQDAGSDVGPFWAAALGYRSLGPTEDVVDRHRRTPARCVPTAASTQARPGSAPHRRQRAGRGRRGTRRGRTRSWREARRRYARAATGGHSPRPRTTASTSPRGPTPRTSRTTRAEPPARARGWRQRTAFLTSSVIRASLAPVSSVSANATGHIVPSSTIASGWNSKVA